MTTKNVDRVSGKVREALLRQMQKQTNTLQLILTGRDYERLTIITDLREHGGKSYVILDCPDDFTEDVPEWEGAAVKIEFLGRDRVQYDFTTRLAKIDKRDLWLEMPDYIERIQRRQFFRVSPPVGTKMTFSRVGKPQDASLIDISEGGALVMLNGPTRGIFSLILGESLRNIRLRCRSENLQTEINIGKAVVLREQSEPGSGHTAYALEFVELDTRERRLLQEFIFRCQREILRRRNEQARG